MPKKPTKSLKKQPNVFTKLDSKKNEIKAKIKATEDDALKHTHANRTLKTTQRTSNVYNAGIDAINLVGIPINLKKKGIKECLQSVYDASERMLWGSIQATQSVSVSESIFIINLNHGSIPLEYMGEIANPVKIMTHVSLVNQVKKFKARIGSCPASNSELHNDLVSKLMTSSSTAPLTDATIMRIIADPNLEENDDRNMSPAEFEKFAENLPTQRRISGYQEVKIHNGAESINKYFLMDYKEKDGGVLLLTQTTILPPLAPRIVDVSIDSIITFAHTHRQNPDVNIRLYIVADVVFKSTQHLTVINDQGGQDVYDANDKLKLDAGMYFEYNERTADGRKALVHVADMRITAYFPHPHIANAYNMYPYLTGKRNDDGLIEYDPFTDLLSCPYFIDYIKNLMEINPIVLGNVRNFTSCLISKCTSLLYPHVHPTVYGFNSLMLTNYLKNTKILYSYDLTCQALCLLKVAVNTYGYTIKSLNQILTDNPRNQRILYNNAKGITKRKRKGKKTNKKTQNKLKRKIH